MAKQHFAPLDTKDSPKIKLGNAKDNKPADSYAKLGTSVSDAERAVGKDEKYPNSRSAQEVNRRTLSMTVAIGDIGPGYSPKKQSIKIRGTGAAERGDKCSDKMG